MHAELEDRSVIRTFGAAGYLAFALVNDQLANCEAHAYPFYILCCCAIQLAE